MCLSAFLLTTREVMVVGHASVIVGVHVPSQRALRECALRFFNLLEERVGFRFFSDDFIPHLKLLLQDGVRCLVELHTVFLLQLDVVFGIAVDGFP